MAINKQKLVKSGLWQFSNTIVIVVSQIVCNSIIARYVTKKEFGVMAITNAFINFACFFSEAGMGDALMQRKIVEPQHKNAALFFSVLISAVLYLILYIVAPWISSFYDEGTILVSLLRVLGLSYLLFFTGDYLLQMHF